MESDGHLCYLCSEIFEQPDELQEHLMDEHEINGDAELDIDTTDNFQSDGDDEVELYDPLPAMADDDIVDEFLLDITTEKKSHMAETSTFKAAYNPIQVHYNQIIQGQRQPQVDNNSASGIRKRRQQLAEEFYQCDQCLFKTKTKSVLKSHKLTHSFDCIFCPFKTVIPDALTAHIKRVHFGDPRAEHQQCSQEQLEAEAAVGRDIPHVKSENGFVLLDSKNHTDISLCENMQVDASRFSYLNVPRQSVIMKYQDSNLIQRAHSFLSKSNL